ncbi:MAG: hypothetical protein E6J90_38520 [Deltaproteobacteria bacterium]|nr:MAG: hypothetical protein E6J90_38520 [Deltaproteobacteria bacterium]
MALVGWKHVYAMSMAQYRNYLDTLSRRFEAMLSSIAAIYNFDLGIEFEIVLCELLRGLLPNRFGVCRGFVITADGQTAGDDIVIYDQSIFPTLQLRGMGNFSRREHVPVEAVYAYIEAKHTLSLKHRGARTSSKGVRRPSRKPDRDPDRVTLTKAMAQAAAVKRLVSSREHVPPNEIVRHLRIEDANVISRPGYPALLNPPYVAIISRFSDVEPKSINEHIPQEYSPDLIVAGSNLSIPLISSNGKIEFISPFFLPGQSSYLTTKTSGAAFGIGMACLLMALDSIQLGRMDWVKIIGVQPRRDPGGGGGCLGISIACAIAVA